MRHIAGRRFFDPARDARGRRPVHHRRAAKIAELHRLPRGRLGFEGQGGEKEGHSRTRRSEEHTSELQSLMRISYAVFCLKKKTISLSETQKLERHRQAYANT